VVVSAAQNALVILTAEDDPAIRYDDHQVDKKSKSSSLEDVRRDGEAQATGQVAESDRVPIDSLQVSKRSERQQPAESSLVEPNQQNK